MTYAMARDDPDEDRAIGGAVGEHRASLIERARSDPALFSELYLQHLDHLFRFLRARLGRTQDAEDVVQQVFLNAWRAFPRFHGDQAGFTAWLFRIARNEAVNWQRRSRPSDRSLDELTSAGFERLSPDPTPEELRLRNERLAGLGEALNHLTPEQQELIHLRFAAELSARQIGDVLCISEGAARQRLHRSLRQLKELMDDAFLSR